MKPVVAFIVTFVVATAGSAGAKVMMTKQAPAQPATVTADSASHAEETSTDTAIVASGQAAAPPVDTAVHAVTPAAADTSKHPAPAVKAPAPGMTPSAPVQTGKANVGTPKVAATKAANDSVTTVSERRVAKVFTSMDAKQAAKVLEHMTDNDVHVILGYVGPRQAASIMAALPPERVAKLSKLAMQGTR